jgi:hypothetical protein
VNRGPGRRLRPVARLGGAGSAGNGKGGVRLVGLQRSCLLDNTISILTAIPVIVWLI